MKDRSLNEYRQSKDLATNLSSSQRKYAQGKLIKLKKRLIE